MGIKYPICSDCEYRKESKMSGCKFPEERARYLHGLDVVPRTKCSGWKKAVSILKEVSQEILSKYRFFRDY